MVSIGLIICMTLLAGMFAFFGFKFSESEKLFPIALFFMLVSLILGVYVIQLGYIYARDILFPLSLEGMQFKIFLGVVWGLIGVGFIGMVFFMLKTLKEIKVRKSQKAHGDDWNENKREYQ